MKYRLIFFCIAITSSLSSHSGFARPAGRPPFVKYLITFDHIQTPNFGVVNCILRDDRGFLWFGTSKGLCKYDGYRVWVFPNGTPLTGPHQVITAMARIDPDSILLATGTGLRMFNVRTEQYFPVLTNPKFADYKIDALLKDPGGTLWIGTDSNGLASYDRASGTLHRYSKLDGLTDERITSLLFDHSNTLWIGTVGGGLIGFDRAASRFTNYRADASNQNALLSDHITALYENRDHELWIGTDRGLNVLDLPSARVRRLELPSKIRHTIYSIIQDPSGIMLIGASDLGVLSYSDGTFSRFPAAVSGSEPARPFNAARVLYLDPVASTHGKTLFWVGTRDGILKVYLSANPFTNHIRDRDSLLLDRGAILSFCEDREGILWLGLWGGGLEALQQVNGGYRRIAHFENDPSDPSSLPSNDVNDIIEDRDGSLWIGTPAGIALLDRPRRHMLAFRHVEGDSTSLIDNRITALYKDRTGNIWFCANGGISLLIRGRPVSFRNYLPGRADADPGGGTHVLFMCEDRESNRWVGTFGRGVLRIEPSGTFRQFLIPNDTPGSQANVVYAMTENHAGVFWFSTGAGLVSFDPHSGEFSRHEIPQLHSAHIFGIVEDSTGTLWMSTGVGLAKFDPATGSFRRFDEHDGLAFTEFFSGLYRDAQGWLLVGATDGFVEFSPENVSTISDPPRIAITSVSLFDQELPASLLAPGELRLPHDRNFCSFTFAALDYANPSRNRFAYRMIGVDQNWVDAGVRNFASYPALDPGSYVFQVKGCNSANVWNEEGASISLLIAPPYWQTWWFRLLLAAFMAGLAYTAYRYRVRHLLEVERLRLRIADDLHDDIGSNLSTIAMASRALQRAPELTKATRGTLVEIYETAIKASEGMKDAVWFITPRNDTLDDLFLRMKDAASTILTDLQHDFRAPEEKSSRRVSINFKRNFFLAFKEILTNIVKHASAARAVITLELRDGMLEAVIEDDGRGFDPDSLAAGRRGNGLQSLRNRAKTVGGTFEISSRPGKGTSVRFSGRL
jgi:ligand-binding sensor domain-containing protein/signal transduction histidine kinase